MIKLSKEEAFALWTKDIGNQLYAYDFSGRKIKKEDYAKENEVGWVVDFICPEIAGGKVEEGNIMIMHHRTSFDKGDAYPKFSVDFKNFEIVHEEKGDYYYIEELLDDED